MGQDYLLPGDTRWAMMLNPVGVLIAGQAAVLVRVGRESGNGGRGRSIGMVEQLVGGVEGANNSLLSRGKI